MVSIGWAMLMFVFGGLAGAVILALIGMAAREEDRGVRAEADVDHSRLRPVHLHRQWRTIRDG
jgi:hypothetical protein